MKVEELMRYALEVRAASSLPPGTAAAVTPLLVTESGLSEIVDGTSLTVEQWLRVAQNGIILLPDDLKMPCCGSHIPAAIGRHGWCLNSKFDGCEPCCGNCPDYD